MTGKKDEDFSRLICTTLDTFGFDRESISFRSNYYKKVSHLTTLQSCTEVIPSTTVFVGSLAEGVGLDGSDIDSMSIFTDSVCVDKGSENRHFNIFEADDTTSSPGYTKIYPAFLDQGSASHVLFNASYMFETQSGRPYISSMVFKNFVHQRIALMASEHFAGLENGDITNNGPAVTRKVLPVGEQDVVACLYFYGGSYLSKWANRARFYTWPSKDLVREVSEKEGYIVPVGDKLSETQNIEWRICYTTAEKKLISSLNDVQMKLYVLLKLIGKKILKPVCKEITSYVVKNVVFWMVETTPAKQFSPQLLLTLVQKSLFFIKHCLQNNHFPNYMIPERNLLAVVHGEDKRRAIRFISKCLEDGASIVLRVPGLLKCIYFTRTSPSRGMYMKMRNEIEKLVFENMSLGLEHYDANLMKDSAFIRLEFECFKDERYLETRLKLLNMLVPEWFNLSLAGRFRELQELLCFRAKGIWVL